MPEMPTLRDLVPLDTLAGRTTTWGMVGNPGVTLAAYLRWGRFDESWAAVREGRACFLLRWHAFTYGPGPGDDRYPVLGKVVDASPPGEGH